MSDRQVPIGFFGAHTDRYSVNNQAVLERELQVMRDAGVETLRVTFLWQQIQFWFAPRYPGHMHLVSDFIKPDVLIGAAARAGFSVVGNVFGAPGWATGGMRPGESPKFPLTVQGGVPQDPADMGNFMGDLIERYGPAGTFWAEHPEIPANPIRIWQPLQEPDRPAFFPQPFDVDHFVAMAHASYQAVKQADPEATVLGAGLGPICADSGDFLDSLYRAGLRGSFDVAAIHPFPKDAAGLIHAVRVNREAMAANGDGELPIALSQFSFSSALGASRQVPLPNMSDEAGQARNVEESLRTIAEHREELNIYGAYYHSWTSLDTEPLPPSHPDPWLWTGLRRVQSDGQIVSKPAFDAFRRTTRELQGRADS